MMSVTVENWTPELTITVKQELESMGYILNKDFEYAFYPATEMQVTGHTWSRNEKYTVYKFYDDSIASWFNLKYVNYVQK